MQILKYLIKKDLLIDMRKILPMLILYLFLITLFPGNIAENNSTNLPPNNTDWVINNETVIENETIILNQNLTINNNGHLIFRNVTLIFNSTKDHVYKIEVKPYGKLSIMNNSKITTPQLTNPFFFIINKYSKFIMKGSEISNCGRDPFKHYSYNKLFDIAFEEESFYNEFGLLINTNNTIIENNRFKNCYRAISLIYSSNNIIKDNLFLDNENCLFLMQSHNNIIENNVLIRRNLTIEKMENDNFLIQLENSNNNIILNNIFSNIQGVISGSNGNNNLIKTNYFYSNFSYNGIMNFQYMNDINIENNSIQYLEYDTSTALKIGPGISLKYCDEVNITNNSIKNCSSSIIVANCENVTITKNYIINYTTGIYSTNCESSYYYNSFPMNYFNLFPKIVVIWTLDVRVSSKSKDIQNLIVGLYDNKNDVHIGDRRGHGGNHMSGYHSYWHFKILEYEDFYDKKVLYNPYNLLIIYKSNIIYSEILNITEKTNLTFEINLDDSDKDGFIDTTDPDDDNDNYLDDWEIFLGTNRFNSNDKPVDTDRDGKPNGDFNNSKSWMDIDDDNDNFTDKEELDADTDPLDEEDYPKSEEDSREMEYPIISILILIIIIILIVLLIFINLKKKKR